MPTSDSFGQSKNTKITVDENIEEGFNVYKTKWNKDKIEFFIDSKLVYTFNPEIKTIRLGLTTSHFISY
ncbi:family 16 glycosylhydrolase [Lacinutrix mariniflava]|uniref:family 16 glycosylhydrolase n=1 Tax=Lacinutrix mariniflava TaxID=342955 RepID=UPI0006E3DBEB|nr:family 16 glycosylhydrolase [Lacinutrix mariniflava]